MRARVRFLAGALALSSPFVSCTGPNSGIVHVTPAAGAPWQEVLAEHTRRDVPYDWLMRAADLRATLVTPRLRKAFLDARADFQGKFADELERELVGFGEPDQGVDVESRPQPESEQQVVFFVAMYVADQKNRDIAASYTIWETTLHRGASVVKPIRIETVRSSPAVFDVFPFADRFDDLYLVRFPLVDASGRSMLAPGEEPLELQVKSALAAASVAWAVRD